jgi:hypothetical protein
VKEKCPLCDSRALQRHIGPKQWVSMQVGHYNASCTRCGELFWRHEDLTDPKSRIPWQAVDGPCGCSGEPELI